MGTSMAGCGKSSAGGLIMKINEIPTPSYILDMGKLKRNGEILKKVAENTGAKILLAQKCFSAFYTYPVLREYICGTTASGLYEAKLGYEEMKKENHVYSPAYRPEDVEELAKICDHMVFNSKRQLDLYAKRVKEINPKLQVGIRVNPECSTQGEHAIYDPCAAGSRLGIRACDFDESIANTIDGIHFHTLCEQNSDDLETTLRAVEEKFGKYLYNCKWLNMGGGHHITRADYDIKRLEDCIKHMRDKYNLEIYLEPGEAVALNAGYLATTVLDVVQNDDKNILILDASAACHMPDVLEMPYTPPLKDAKKAGVGLYNYILSANTCLAGDIIGEYSFDKEIKIGDRLYFEDMAIYSMVKNNTFNGIPLPSIACLYEDGECRIIKEFGYEDFKGRLS